MATSRYGAGDWAIVIDSDWAVCSGLAILGDLVYTIPSLYVTLGGLLFEMVPKGGWWGRRGSCPDSGSTAVGAGPYRGH